MMIMNLGTIVMEEIYHMIYILGQRKWKKRQKNG